MDAAGFPAERRLELEALLQSAFSPHAPINRAALFRGRIEQVRAATDTISSPGLHAVIYGERGAGKTSLSNILGDLLEQVVAASRVNCATSDTFTSVMKRSLKGLRASSRTPGVGFMPSELATDYSLAELLPDENGDIAPDTVAEILASLPRFVVLVVDEFDRLSRPAGTDFADLLKAMSDRGSETTMVLVGVAESIDQLLESHASVERCIRQIQLPRMSDAEIREIVEKGFTEAAFGIAGQGVHRRIIGVSQGFPHYAHLLSQNAGRAALDAARLEVKEEDVVAGMDVAVGHADQSHRELYFKAITGTKKQNLWTEVVAACALAQSDERGFFPSRAVQESLSAILGRDVIQQTVAFHLGKLIEPSRGPLLERKGPERRYRYRFINPLMRPFVLMKATADGVIQH